MQWREMGGSATAGGGSSGNWREAGRSAAAGGGSSGNEQRGHAGDKIRSQVRGQTITWIDGHLVGRASFQRFISLLGATNPYAIFYKKIFQS